MPQQNMKDPHYAGNALDERMCAHAVSQCDCFCLRTVSTSIHDENHRGVV